MLDVMTSLSFRLARPVSTLRRSCGALQIGLDAAASAVVPAAPVGAEVALRSFRQWRSAPEAAALSGVDLDWLEPVVHLLVGRGVLTAHPRPAARGGVVVLGGGSLAHRIVSHLAGGGVPHFRIADLTPGPPETALWRQAAGDAGVHLVDHWRDAVARPAALVVVAPRTVEVDRWLTDHLLDAGLPHLVARLEPERAVVGPFVFPRGTPCVRCLDLHRCDLDADWPLLVAQLATTWHEPAALAEAWAASTAAVQALAWLDRGVPPGVGVTLELPDATLALETRAWTVHPRCPCAQR